MTAEFEMKDQVMSRYFVIKKSFRISRPKTKNHGRCFSRHNVGTKLMISRFKV